MSGTPASSSNSPPLSNRSAPVRQTSLHPATSEAVIRFSIRKSFALGRIDIGFPGSYAHQVFQKARTTQDQEAKFDVTKYIIQAPGQRATKLLLPLPALVIALLHHLLPLCLLIQVLAYLTIMVLMNSENFWLRPWIIRLEVVKQGWADKDLLTQKPFHEVMPPVENFGFITWNLYLAWNILVWIYLPLALFHMIWTLDQEPDGQVLL